MIFFLRILTYVEYRNSSWMDLLSGLHDSCRWDYDWSLRIEPGVHMHLNMDLYISGWRKLLWEDILRWLHILDDKMVELPYSLADMSTRHDYLMSDTDCLVHKEMDCRDPFLDLLVVLYRRNKMKIIYIHIYHNEINIFSLPVYISINTEFKKLLQFLAIGFYKVLQNHRS